MNEHDYLAEAKAVWEDCNDSVPDVRSLERTIMILTAIAQSAALERCAAALERLPDLLDPL